MVSEGILAHDSLCNDPDRITCDIFELPDEGPLGPLGDHPSSELQTMAIRPRDMAASTAFYTNLASACGGSSGSDQPSTQAPPPSGSIVSDRGSWTGEAIENLSEGYRRAQGVWTGFDPNEHPTVVPYWPNSEEIESVLAINFPFPESLGDATPLDTSGTPFESLHVITNLADDVEASLEAIPNFDFNVDLAGVDSFVMVACGFREVFEPATVDWTATFLHEMFHRYQNLSFRGSEGEQDVEGYAYSTENLSLAMLEDRALKAAITTDDGTERERAARRVAAIRMARLAADGRVRLDDDQ